MRDRGWQMPENHTLMVEKGFMTRLRNLICCSEGMGTCDGGEFCSSNPADWPTITNGHIMVSLSQPENKRSIPGIDQFRDKYTKWNRDNDCISLLATFEGLSKGLTLFSTGGSLSEKLLATDEGTHGNKNQATSNAVELALRKRCSIFYDKDEAGVEQFNPARAEDLKKINEFLAATSNLNLNDDGNGFHWNEIFKGGGILSAGSFLIWLLYKIFRFGKKGKGHLNESRFIIRGIGDGINSLASAIKYLFGTSLPNLGKALHYAASFKWVKGEKPPENLKAPESDTAEGLIQDEMAPAPREGVDVKPHPDVVLAQLYALIGSEHHAMEGRKFAALTDDGKKYLAAVAIRHWSTESESRRQIFAEEDDRLTEGKLPNDFLFKIVRHYLKKDANISILDASARVWAEQMETPHGERSELPMASEFTPTLIAIKRQLLNDAHFQNAGTGTREYIAMLAKAEWDVLPDEAKRSFITVNDTPETGILPQQFVRAFRKKIARRMNNINLKSELRQELAVNIPSALECQFNVLDKRLSSLIRAWRKLPDEIKRSFEAVSHQRIGASGIPLYFIEYIFKIIGIGHLAMVQSLPNENEWKLEVFPNLSYQSYSLSDAMENIATLDKNLRMYPELLKVRAKSIIDAWVLLEGEVRQTFVNEDDTQEMRISTLLKEELNLVPKNFTALIHKFSLETAIFPRSPIKKGSGGQGGGSSAKASPAGEEVQGNDEQNFTNTTAAMVAMRAVMEGRNSHVAGQGSSQTAFVQSKYIASIKSAGTTWMQQANPVMGTAALFAPTLQPRPLQMMPQLQPTTIIIR